MKRVLLLSLGLSVASALSAQSNTVPGLDGRLEILDNITYWGRRGGAFPGGEVGLSMRNTMCNPGLVSIPWFAQMQENHPKFGFMITRLSNGRMEQISDRSYCKHAFVSASTSGACGPCNGIGGNMMGVTCSDTYSAGNNASRGNLGPADEIDPWLGTWNHTGSYFDQGDPNVGFPGNVDGQQSNINVGNDDVKNRVTVKESDLQIAGASYYYGIHLIHEGEAVANRWDNLKSRGMTASWTGGSWNVSNSGVGEVFGSILQHWTGATVNNAGNGNDDGRFFVASKVTPLGGGMYHYEYAIHNADNSRGGASFRVPLAPGAVVANAGFRDIDQNPLNDWAFTQTSSEITFAAVGTNALNWNSIYNCWFDCSIAPGAGSMTIDEARTGPGALSVVIPSEVPSGLSFAAKASVGTSCGNCTGTVYERFATTNTFDLAGRSMTMSLNQGAYDVVGNNVAFVPAAGTNLGLSLNSQSTVTLPFTLPYPGGSTTQLRIASSGYAYAGPLFPVQLAANQSLFLSGSPRWAPCWTLLSPVAGANNVFYDATPARVIITWSGIPMIGASVPSTFQMQAFPDGTVNYVWQTIAPSSFAALVGWSSGGGYSDPGSSNLSSSLSSTQSLCSAPFDGISLDTDAMPVLGTTVQWQIAGFPAATSWGAMMRSVHRASPAIDLTALGMPGCFAHLTDPVTTLVVSPGTTAQVPEVLPNNTALLGVTVVGQAASYNPSLSPLGVVLSNAIVLELGF
jgi:hypothetical protein